MSDSDESGAPGPALPSPQDVLHHDSAAPGPVSPSPEDMLRDDPLLRLDNVSKAFPVQSSSLFKRSHEFVHAVDNVSLDVYPGETLGLVGETGCGKSTLARCIARLYDLSGGSVTFDGQDISHLSRRDMRPLRRQIQMIFQDPYGSLNPRRRVGSIIGDPFVIHGIDSRVERKKKVQDLMELVGLNPEHYNRFPAEFSGGQRQRIGTARALALRPRMVICDEPVSALDVSIQAQVINLLKDLQDDFGLTYIFISHDLSVVRHVSDRIAVMYLGNIVEVAPSSQIFDNTRHPYTRALLSALPVADPDEADRRERIVLVGDIPSPTNPPSGCRFHTRCPKARPDCVETNPVLEQVFDDGAEHLTACLHPLALGEDMTLAEPQIEDSEIVMTPTSSPDTGKGGTP
jgi:peptide/nickel transport system ATP-binding protein